MLPEILDVLEGTTECVLLLLYLPNGNPIVTPKFDYKLKWMERFMACARNAGIASTICCSTRRRRRRLKAAGVDTWLRAREKAGDHAPAWVLVRRR